MKLSELINTGEGVIIAMIPETDEESCEWNVYIINTKKEEIKNVLINSEGYGEINDKKIKTSTLRWYFDVIPADGHALVEIIMEEVFGLSNQYWVSYSVGDTMYDKRFIFLPESIQRKNMIIILSHKTSKA